MTVYLLNFISIPIYGLIFKKKKRVIIVLVALQMFLMLSLRSQTLGTDLANYKIFYEAYREMSVWEIIRGFRPIGGSTHDYGVESGYVLFNWIIGKMGINFHGFLVIYAAIVISSVAIFIDRYCKRDPALALATFVSIGGFTSLFFILRQSLGLAILLFAIPALVDRKFWHFLIVVFLAALFHQSLFVALLLYPLSIFKANKGLYVATIASSLLLVAVTPYLYNNFVFPLLLKLGRVYYIDDFTWNNLFAVMVLIAIMIMIFYKNSDRWDNTMQCGYLLTIPIQALAFYIPVFSRLAGAVFINFLCVLIPGLVYSFNTESQRIQAKTIAYVGMFVFYLYTLIIDNVLVPYVPFWAAV